MLNKITKYNMTLRNPLPDNSLAEHWDVRLCSLWFDIDSHSLTLTQIWFSPF